MSYPPPLSNWTSKWPVTIKKRQERIIIQVTKEPTQEEQKNSHNAKKQQKYSGEHQIQTEHYSNKGNKW